MWQQNVTRVLTHLGWGSGFRLPMANKENLALERELEKRQRILQERQAELEDVIKHNEILESGIKNACQHIEEESKLQSAKRTERLAEEEITKLSDREMGKSSRELKLAKEEFRKTKKRNWELCKELEDRKKDLSELVQLIEYDKLELLRLEKEAEGQDVYLKMLEDLCEDDAEGLKKYEARYTAAAEAVTAARAELDKEVSLTRVAQNELEGLSDRFRKLHKERTDVTNLWRGTLISLSNRDAEMKYIAEAYKEMQAEFKSMSSVCECEMEKYHDQKKTAENAMLQLNRWDRKVGEIREEIKNTKEIGESLRDNVIGYEVGLSLTSKQIESLSRKCKEIDEEIAGMDEKIAQSSIQIENLRARAQCIQVQAITANERNKQINLIADDEERNFEAFAKLLEKEMIQKSQWAEKKIALIKESMDFDHKIRGADTNFMALQTKIKEANLTLEKRKQTIYKMEIQGISLELRIKPMINPRLFPKFNEYEEKLLELKEIHRKVVHNLSFVTNQTGHLDDVLRRVFAEKNEAIVEILKLSSQSSEQRICVKLAQKNLKLSEEDLKNALVDFSLTKLKLTQLLKTIKEQKDQLYDSESHRLLLQSVAKEKRIEIEVHSKLLEVRRRALKEALSPMKLELAQISANVTKKKKRYEIVMRLLAKPSDDKEEVKSEAYYVLQMAQERELLQKEGDKWDMRVKEVEEECEAMQNTLALFKCENDLFKDSLKPIVADESYEAELRELEQKKKDVILRKNKAIKELKEREQEISAKLCEIENAKQEKTKYENQAMDKHYEFGVLQADTNSQAISIKRAQSLGIKLLQELNFSGKEEKAVISLDLKFRITKRKLEFALQALARLVNLYPEMSSTIARIMCEQYGQEVAVKFLQRINPFCTSPSGSAKSIKSVRSAKSAKSEGNLSKRSSRRSSATASVRRTVSVYDSAAKTESNKRLLKGVVSAVEKSRKIVLAQREKDIERRNKITSNEATKSIQTDKEKRLTIEKKDSITDPVIAEMITPKHVEFTEASEDAEEAEDAEADEDSTDAKKSLQEPSPLTEAANEQEKGQKESEPQQDQTK